MNVKEKLAEELAQSVVEMDEDNIVGLAQNFIEAGYTPEEGIQALIEGMNRVNILYEENEYFVPELLFCTDTMYEGINEFKKHLVVEDTKEDEKVTILLGVPQGDTHDIGKNLVKIMMEAAGYNVIDLGRDVPTETFVEATLKNNADVIGLSTLMSTTMIEMENVIKALKDSNIRDKVKVIIGGGPITQSFASKIGADGYSDTANNAVRLVKKLTELEV